MRLAARTLVLVALVAWPGRSLAQDAAAGDSALVAAARAARQAYALCGGDTLRAPAKGAFLAAVERLERGAGSARPSWRLVARMRADSLDPRIPPDPESDLHLVMNFLHSYFRPCLEQAPGAAAMLDPIETVADQELRAALARTQERLRRYQVKFGERSVPLNWVELLLYQGVLQKVPGFGPSVTRGPGPWEPVASYSPLYAELHDERAIGVPVLELGLRHYNFGHGWGTASGVAGMLRPAYVAFGTAVVPERQTTLNPFAGKEHWGAFVTWGDLKLAYVGAPSRRWLVSKQVQFIRNVF